MRCFISIDLPEEVKKELAAIQKQIPRENAKILDVNPNILHLTLRFLDEIDDFKVNQIKKILENLKIKKFKAKISKIGVFPDENFIRVVWTGLEPSEKFREMHEIIDNELEKIGMKKEERFESHVTLCRVKFVKDKKAFIEGLKKIKVKEMEFNVDSIKLKKSTLTEEGPVYEDIADINLI
jgi:2'-5' RNA ligase